MYGVRYAFGYNGANRLDAYSTLWDSLAADYAYDDRGQLTGVSHVRCVRRTPPRCTGVVKNRG